MNWRNRENDSEYIQTFYILKFDIHVHVVKTVYYETWLEILHISHLLFDFCKVFKRVCNFSLSPELDPFLLSGNYAFT